MYFLTIIRRNKMPIHPVSRNTKPEEIKKLLFEKAIERSKGLDRMSLPGETKSWMECFKEEPLIDMWIFTFNIEKGTYVEVAKFID